MCIYIAREEFHSFLNSFGNILIEVDLRKRVFNVFSPSPYHITEQYILNIMFISSAQLRTPC
ncbi:MAG: hypothetical protein BMS9Abin06_0429 [Gammaproteobacteria bacterium]|nr:MAG: hypothetical protein BMS9Abin06_0429 [Gammaproteobacteria bacterium]